MKTLAEEIQAAQGPEIDTMTGWLKAWGEDVPDESTGGMDGMDSGSGDSMPGMMADTEIADGKNPDAIALATSIKAAQTTEIATMKNLLAP